jgi:hypothetical protein
MGVEWRNSGEPIDGLYVVDVDPEDGSAVQTFKGETFKEAADKLANAQFHASRAINELKQGRVPDRAVTKKPLKPRELTEDEKFQAAQDMRDPNKVTEAMDRVMEARLGGKPNEVAARLNSIDEKELENQAIAEVNIFIQTTPDWYQTEENKNTLFGYIRDNNLAWTAKNYRIVFDKLMSDGLLTRRPETTTETPETPETNAHTERIAPQQTTRPRGSFSSGVRASTMSNVPPGKPKPKYTRQEIELMPRAVFKHKMENEAGFAQFVDQLPA